MLGHRPLVPEDYMAMLKRRWWVVLIPLVLLPIVAYAFSYLIPPRYLSQTLVIIEGQKVPDDIVRPVVSEDLDSRLASMKEQILSRSHLQPIIERYNLYGNHHLDMDDRIDLVRKDIEIRPIHSAVPGTGLPGFFILFKADDAHTAQLVCSDITTLFVNESLQQTEQSAEGTTDFLKGQLDDAKRSLDEQDAKMAAFERQYTGRLPGQESANSDMLTSLNTQLETVNEQLARQEQDRSYLQALLAQQGAQTTTSSSGTVSTSVPNPVRQEDQAELQNLLNQRADLLAHYTKDYPDVKAIDSKIADLRAEMSSTPKTLPSGSSTSSGIVPRESPAILQLRAQLRAADVGIDEKRKQQASIQARIGGYQARIESSPLIEEQYKEITRDYQTAKMFYDDLLSKMNHAQMATDLQKRQQGEQFTVMDAANLPDAPFSPKRRMFLGSGAAFGFALGLAIAALLEYRDTSIRNDRDVWAFTNLPTLGLIGFSNAAMRATPHRSHEGRKRRLRLPFRKPSHTAGAQG